MSCYSIFRLVSALDNCVYDLRQFGEINFNSNDQPSRDGRIPNSFHMHKGVGFESRENENVNTPKVHGLPIAHTASNADTGEYSTLDHYSHYSNQGPTVITHPPGDGEREYSHLHHSTCM